MVYGIYSFRFAYLISVGFIAYVVRTKRRILYGIIELSFAFVTLWMFIPIDATAPYGFAGSNIQWLGSAGSIYVAVRALDNIEVGLRPHAKAHEWLDWVLSFFDNPRILLRGE
jgi:hypothetical protein